MALYDPNIDEWIYLIKHNHIEHCREQELMIDNNLVPALERKDVYIDSDRIARGLSLQRYFPFKLLPWEKFQFAVIFGVFLRNPGAPYDDIYFHKIFDIIGRGAGKNGFIDYCAFYMISPLHGVKGYNVDLIANGEEQASTSIRDVSDLINDPPDPKNLRSLKENFKGMAEKVVGKKMQAEFRLNTTSTKNKDSKRTGCIIFDEKHQYTDTANMNTLKSGTGKMKWSREITITTDGHERGGILDKEKDQAAEILRCWNPENRTFINWFRIEQESEWSDIKKIVKAVPSLTDPSFSSLKFTIQQEIDAMQSTPDYYYEFLAKRCNFPVTDPEKAVADWEQIVKCSEEPPFEIRQGAACVAGIDYVKTNDFMGCVLVFRSGANYAIKHHSFICRRSRDLPGIKAPIAEWEKKGYCTVIDDVEISPGVAADWLLEQGQQYDIRMLGLDNFRFSLLSGALKDIGFQAFDKESKNIYLVRPSDIMKASPQIGSLFATHRLYGFDPMMRWYTNNTKAVTDSRGNITYAKIEPKLRKTDGFMAFVNAICCTEYLPEESEIPDIPWEVITF